MTFSLPLFDRPTIAESKLPGLRPYQEKAIRLARSYIELDKKRILLVVPVGGGKTVMFASIIRTATVPVLVVVDRIELIDQAVDQLARQGIHNVGVIRANDPRTNPDMSVQVASIQTLMRREKPKAGLVICDEAHLCASDSWREHVFAAYPDAIILGFTATPCRNDGKPLGDLFEVLEVIVTYQVLFKRPDWLVEPDCYSAPAIDLSSVHMKHGDFDENELGEVMSQKLLIGNMLDHWKRLAHLHPVVDSKTRSIIPGKSVAGERRRTFIFTVNIKHSKAICERFAEDGIRIAHLDAKTPADERKAMLTALRAGELECISNVGIFLKGIDAPEVKCVIHARPTWSLVLWTQSSGRIFRPWNNVRPLILDHAGNWGRHGPPHEDRVWSLTHEARRKTNANPLKICRQCFAYVSVGLSVCPYCKYFFTTQEMTILKETSDTLVLRDATPEVVRKEFFDKAALMSRVKGYKPGFASAKHKERYGEWPPRAWSEAVKAMFVSDTFWQDAVAKRQKRKEQEEAAFEAACPEMQVGEDPAGLGPEVSPAENAEFDESFAGWVEREVRQ